MAVKSKMFCVVAKAYVLIMLCVIDVAYASEKADRHVVYEGLIGVHFLYHGGDMTAYGHRDDAQVAQVLAVCGFGDRCRISGEIATAERIGEHFFRIDSVTRVAAAPKEPVDISGVLAKGGDGHWFVAFKQYGAEIAVVGSAGPTARQVGAVCADGDICRLKGVGSRDPKTSWVMPSELHEVELVWRARLVTVEMTGTYSGGSMGNFDIVGDEEDQFLDGLEQFENTPVGRTMPSCERYRVVALVRDTDPHRVVDLLAVGCARPYASNIPAAVEGGPQ